MFNCTDVGLRGVGRLYDTQVCWLEANFNIHNMQQMAFSL